jgi:hypothetical protein
MLCGPNPQTRQNEKDAPMIITLRRSLVAALVAATATAGTISAANAAPLPPVSALGQGLDTGIITVRDGRNARRTAIIAGAVGLGVLGAAAAAAATRDRGGYGYGESYGQPVFGGPAYGYPAYGYREPVYEAPAYGYVQQGYGPPPVVYQPYQYGRRPRHYAPPDPSRR